MSAGVQANSPSLLLGSYGSPLRMDEEGVIRVGASRISLDLLVEQYKNGMTPEDMVRAYDTLELADVYGAIACYLRHHDQLDAYLHARASDAEANRRNIESQRRSLTL